MKKVLFLLFLVIPMSLSSQVIDWKNFDEKAMNDAVYNKVCDYIVSTNFRTDNGSTVKGTAPMKYVEGMKCVCMNKLESFDKVHRKKSKTYQELADRCIQDWKSEGVMSLTLWSKSVEITCKYKKINQTVSVWFTSRY